jgi:hypothetical protein
MNDIPNINNAPGRITGRFIHWIFSRRIMRRILLGSAGFITLIAAVYAWVDWHGERAWENCKREMTAKGEVWDWSAYAPAPVPDDQNIFKAPKIAEWFGDNRGLLDAPLDQRITNAFAKRLFNANSTTEIKTRQAADSYLAWSDQFQDDFDTIAAALKRPEARIVADYSHPISITLPNAATCHAVVITLEQRAKCHLILGQPDKAWQELTILRDMRRLVDGQGKFITTEGEWMKRGLAMHSLQAIAKGLELHAWQEPQLIALQDQLKNTDFIAGFIEALKCARALLLSSLANGELEKTPFMSGGDGVWTRLKKHPGMLLFAVAPRGSFFYDGNARKARDWRNMIDALGPANGVFRPNDVSKAFVFWKRAQQGLPALLRTQTLANEAQIACALERYRLAHGEYPETLDALVSQFIEKLPRDIINGEPLHYRRIEDGSFLLYSVGWNETDDGGQIVLPRGDPQKATIGDWVWKNSMSEF